MGMRKKTVIEFVDDNVYGSRLTIGNLLEGLNLVDDKEHCDLYVVSGGDRCKPNNPHSFRGYYNELAFEPSNTLNGTVTVSEFIEMINDKVLNKTFRGWKGGEFIMDKNTPIWLSYEGNSSDEFFHSIEILDNGIVLIKTGNETIW